MSTKDQPTVKHLREQMAAVDAVLGMGSSLVGIGLDSKETAKARAEIREMQGQLAEHIGYLRRFNDLFSADGWLAHDSLNFEVLKEAADAAEEHGKSQATEVLVEYYGAAQVAERAIFLDHVEELRIRRRFIDFALVEHAAGRHYSAVPLLLMVMDGAMNDAFGKGLHAAGLDLDVWDSLMTADGAIYQIKEAFQKGRRKTRDESIDMPYRNGILHGMDLGYDNPVVTAKCWCFLFVVRDWILSKRSEPERKKALEKERHVPNLSELAEQLGALDRLKRANRAWEARCISQEYLESLTGTASPADDSPESVVLELLAFWKKQNYGGMAKLFWKTITQYSKSFVREIRQDYGHVKVKSYTIERILDKTPAIAEVDAMVSTDEDSSAPGRWSFRLIHEDDDGQPVPANLAGGRWQIVWIHRDEE